jgi:hypothetical protein
VEVDAGLNGKMIKALLLSVLLTGCSALGMLKPGGPTVNANAQVGAENTQQVVANQESTEISAESVIQNEIQDIPPWVMLLLILGWILPSPKEIWLGFLKTILVLLGKRKLDI